MAMPSLWLDDMIIDRQQIDADHHAILTLIDAIKLASDDDCPTLVESLDQLLGEHFTREEELQAAVGYPLCAMHLEQHRAISAEIRRLRAEIAEPAEQRRQCLAFTVPYFLDHIMSADLSMLPHFER